MTSFTGQIIPVGPDYAAVLAALHAASFAVAEQWPEAALRDLVVSYGTITGLAVWNDNPVGFVMLRCVAGEAEILTLCVTPDFQKCGVGAQLVAWAIQQAKRSAADVIFLEVSCKNKAAYTLYQKNKFVQSGLRKNYYPDGSDAFVMQYDSQKNSS